MNIRTFLLASMLFAPLAWADDAHRAHAPAQRAPAGQLGADEGEIRKVDKEQGKLTIKHGPLTGVDMPPMTMVFRVKDAAMLDGVLPGDKVKLVVAKIEGALTVVELRKDQAM